MIVEVIKADQDHHRNAENAEVAQRKVHKSKRELLFITGVIRMS